jgi:hypothetical protein
MKTKTKAIKSITQQQQHGTLERNMVLSVRILNGEKVTLLSKETGLTMARIYQIFKAYKENYSTLLPNK